MTDDKTRAEFETKTPVPEDVQFNEQRQEYVWRNFQTTPAPFNAIWESFCDGWQAAKERYGQYDYKEKYHDLLFCVAEKFPDETRHETAKRLILGRQTTHHAWVTKEQKHD